MEKFIQACRCKQHSCEAVYNSTLSTVPKTEVILGLEIVFDKTMIPTISRTERFQMNKDKKGVIFSGGKVAGVIESCPTRQSGGYTKKK